jgi:glycosyltransferase involved in cell wall biosynthesis
VRVCLIYDCLFPYTVGGAERRFRNLAELLAAEGHEVTYLTLRQWDRRERPDLPGARISVAGPRMRLYAPSGRRRIVPPLVFGAGVLWHLLRDGGRYDVVHTASFPYFSVLAAAVARRRFRFSLVVDWHEFWTRGYWREYLGPLAGWVGWTVQALCLRIRQRAFCFSHLTEARLREHGIHGSVTRLEGEYAGPTVANETHATEPLVVFAGRLIPEKRAGAIVAALARARESIPNLRARILGDGPERPALLAMIARYGLSDAIEAPGRVAPEQVEDTLGRALCLVVPSRREGYGIVIVEAAARGTPSVVVRAPDNAAVELIEDGVNGFVVASAAPEDLAGAILAIDEAGPAFRASTAAWFNRNASRLTVAASLEQVLTTYAEPATASARS